MVRRVNLLPSSRLFVSVLCVAWCGIASAQSTDAVRPNPVSRTPFRVAQAFPLTPFATSLASGDLNGDGHPDLVITRVGSGSVSVLLGNGKGSFAAGVDYAAGTAVSNALVADFNGDGKLDVAVTDSATGSIDVLFGNGDGSFGKAAVYTGLMNPVALVAGRFSASGKTDLAVASSTGVSVLLNDGAGHFASATAVPVASQPRSLAAADLKAAGHDDLVLAGQDGSVTVLLGDGDGHFSAQPAISAAAGPLSSIISGDFNSDGKADLAIAQANSNVVTVLLGRGDGSFSAGVNYTVGNGPSKIVAAALTGSSATDLVSINQFSNTFSVLVGKGDGTFQPSIDFVAGNLPLGVVAGDFNADGKADLAIASSQDQTLTVPLGRGDGTFAATRSYRAADLVSKSVAAGDLNGDGRTDLVVSNYCGTDSACSSNGTATIFLANADGSYRAASTLALGNGPVAVALADLHGSNKLDLIALNSADKTLSIFAGNGDGTFGNALPYSLSANPRAVLVGDFNGDGKPDLAIASDCGLSTCTQSGSLDIWLGNGDGSLKASASYTLGFSPVSIAAADLRSTGHLDLVIANACGDDSTCKSAGTATLLFGDGTGKFTQSGEIALGSSPSSIAIGNLSGSGLDLAVAERGSNQVAVLHADGKGGFGAPVAYAVGTAPSALAIADINGDGQPDLAVANSQSSNVSVLYGSGSGKLQSAISYPVSANPESLVAIASAGHATSLVTTNGSGAMPMGGGVTPLGGPGATSSNTALTASPTASAVSQPVTLTAVVTGSGATPTGSVTFTAGATALTDCNGGATDTVNLDGTGTAICITQLLPLGSDTAAASYGGDTTYNVSSGTAAETVAQADTTTTLSTSGSPSAVSTSVTFTATVAATAPATGSVAYSGNVTFTDSLSSLTCTNIPVDPTTGIALCTTSTMTAGSHTVTATYANDTNYAGSTSNSVTQNVTPAPTTVAVNSISPASVTVDEAPVITATVSPSNGSVGNFAGSITFYAGGTSIPGCVGVSVNTTSGVATCTVAAGFAVGAQSITAAYNTGDPNYAASAQSSPQSITVGKAPTRASVSPSPSTSTVDQSVTLNATITPNPASNAVSTANLVAMTGNVSFSDSGTGISGCASQPITYSSASGTATASCITSALAAGGHSDIIATYLGNTSYNSSPANTPATVTVSKASSTVSVTASPASPTLNNPVTYTAAITFPNPLAIAPLGTDTVSFSDNGTTIGACSAQPITVTATSYIYQATCGGHAIFATFSGDTNYLSTSGNLSLSIASATPTTTVSSSLNPSTVNAPVAFTVNVMGGTTVAVTGTASVSAGATPLGQCTLGTWSAATGASCSVSASSLSVGNHSITASYSGNSSYNSSSTASALTQVVNKASTSLTASSSSTGNTSTINTSVTFTASISVPSGGSTGTTPTGTVLFTDTPSGMPAANINGCTVQNIALTGTVGSTATYTATCQTSTLILGAHTITATYTGDGNFIGSANTTTQTVTTANSTTAVSAVLSPSTVDQTVSFQATVTAPSGNATPTGTMAFTDTINGVTANISTCAAVSLTSGTYVCTTNALIQGTHTITANYPGDKNFEASSASTTQVVNKAASSLTLTGSSNTVTANNVATLVFTATVAPNAGPIYPTGNVVFTDTSGTTNTMLCTSAVSPTGVATCSPTSLPPGTNTIQAAYAGDSNFAAVAAGAQPTFTVAVQDFSLTLSGPTNVNGVPTVAVTQQAQSTADLFSPVTITVTPASISSYSGTVTLSCSSPSTGAPKCDIPPSLSLSGTGTPVPGSVVIDATSANPGNYTFTLTGTDSTTGLTHSLTFTVIVRALAGPLALVSGATTGNTANVNFVLPAGVSLSSLECLSVVGTGITAQNVPPSAISVGCTFNPATIPSSGSLQTGTTVVTITTGTTAASSLDRSSGLLIAGLFGIPIFGLFGFRRGRKSIGSVFLRLIAILAFTAAAYQVMGCGGSFQRPPATQGQTPAGQYYLLIQGTGTPGNGTYQAVLELDVSL
jgi:hypothetical protein